VLKKRARRRRARCSIPDDHSAQILLTKHSGGANSRNGYRERALATCAGTLTPRIPKLRTGSFFPDDAIERHRRVGRALVAAAAETCATGTSTRKVVFRQPLVSQNSIRSFHTSA